jgi:hypothetical protein
MVARSNSQDSLCGDPSRISKSSRHGVPQVHPVLALKLARVARTPETPRQWMLPGLRCSSSGRTTQPYRLNPQLLKYPESLSSSRNDQHRHQYVQMYITHSLVYNSSTPSVSFYFTYLIWISRSHSNWAIDSTTSRQWNLNLHLVWWLPLICLVGHNHWVRYYAIFSLWTLVDNLLIINPCVVGRLVVDLLEGNWVNKERFEEAMGERKEGIIALFNIDGTLTHLGLFYRNNNFPKKKNFVWFLVSNTHVVTGCNKSVVH